MVSRPLLSSSVLVGLALVLLAVSPLGTYIAGVILSRAAPTVGWHLRVESTSGWLAGTPTLHHARLQAAQGDITIDIERVSFAPWSYRVEVGRPVVAMILADAAPASADSSDPGTPPRLPIGKLPAIVMTAGAFELRNAADSLLFLATDVDLELKGMPTSPDGGEPAASARIVVGQLLRPGETADTLMSGNAEVSLMLRPGRVQVEPFLIDLAFGENTVAARAMGTLLLEQQWPVDFDLHLEEHATFSRSSNANTRLRGTLSPLALGADLAVAAVDSTVGDLHLKGRLQLTNSQIALDSSQVSVLGGELRLRASYDFGAAAVTVEAEAFDLQAGRLGLGSIGGLIDGRLEATVSPARGLSSGSLVAGLTGARLMDKVQKRVDLRADLSPREGFKATVDSDIGRLVAAGHVDLSSTSYDLALTGHLDPTAILGPGLGRLDVSGRLLPDDLFLRLRAADLAYLRNGIGPAGLDLHLLDGQRLSVNLVTEGVEAQARLEANLKTGQLDTLEALAPILPMDRIFDQSAGNLRAHLSGGGHLSRSGARLAGQVELAALELYGWDLGDVSLDLALEQGRARVLLRGAGVAVEALADTTGSFAGNAVLTNANFARPTADGSVERPYDQVSASGRARWVADVNTDLADWEVELELDSLSATLAGYRLRSDGSMRILHANRSTVIDSLRLFTPIGALVLAGTLGDSLELFAAIDSLTLAQTFADLEGSGSARLDLSGTVRQPQAQGRVSLAHLVLGARPVGDIETRLSLADALSPDSLIVAALLKQAADGFLSIRFSMAADDLLPGGSHQPASRATLGVEAIDLDASGPLAYATGSSLIAKVGLRSRFSVPASDPSAWDQAEGALEINRLDLGNHAVRIGMERTDGTVIRLSRGNQIEMPAAAALAIKVFDRASGEFEAAGRVLVDAVRQGGGTTIGIEFERVDLRVAQPLTSGAVELPDGTVDASLVFSDSTQGIGLRLATKASFDDWGEFTLDAGVSATDVFSRAVWVAPHLDSLVVAVDVPWQMQDRSVDWDRGRLRARSDGINLSLFIDELPQLRSLDGLARVDLEILGLVKPLVQGQIEVQDLRVSLLDVSPGYEIPKGRLRFTGSSRGEFEDFVGGPTKGDRGRLELSGFVDLAVLNDLAYEFVLTAQNLPYNYDDTFHAPDVDFRMSLSRDRVQTWLAGKIRLNGAQVEPALLNTERVPPPPTLKDPFFEGIAVDIDIDMRKTKVKNELIDLMLEGHSKLHGTFYKPRFQGEIQLLPGGSIIVLNREFVLKHGRIILDRSAPTYSILDLAYDPLLLNPEIDIEAVAHVWSYDEGEEKEVTMMLSGTALQSEPRFWSAGLGDTQVIGLLVFGSSDSPTDALYTAAGQLLLSRQVTRVGLDEFTLLPSGTVLGSVGRPSMRVGKFFSLPVPFWVRYETPTGQPSRGQVRFEYKPRSLLTFKGSSQSEYNLYGASIGIKKSF